MKDFLKISFLPLVALAFLAGCEEYSLAFSETKPARYEIPEEVKKVAIVPFTTEQNDAKWGQIAAAKLENDLNEYTNTFGGFTIVSRDQLGDILKRRRDEAKLATGGKLNAQEFYEKALGKNKSLRCNAMIYGTVTTSYSEAMETYETFSLITRQPKVVSYIHRVGTATVTYRLIDLATTKMIANRTITTSFDSNKKDDRLALDPSGAVTQTSVLSKDRILQYLVERCSQEFVSLITTHEEPVEVMLTKGTGDAKKLTERGNILASTRVYGKSVLGVFGNLVIKQRKETLKQSCVDAIEIYNNALKKEPGANGLYINIAACNEWIAADCLRQVEILHKEKREARNNADEERRTAKSVSVKKALKAKFKEQKKTILSKIAANKKQAKERLEKALENYKKAFMSCEDSGEMSIARNGKVRIEKMLEAFN